MHSEVLSMKAYSRLTYGHRTKTAAAFAVSLALVLTLALSVASCGSGGTGSTDATAPSDGTTAVTGQGGDTEVQVIMTNRSYDPQTVTVAVGGTVTWVNQDAPQHDVVADNGEFSSQLFDKGQSFSFTFTTAGTYPYHCTIHPGMNGTVVVQ
jgi:plastocyanin